MTKFSDILGIDNKKVAEMLINIFNRMGEKSKVYSGSSVGCVLNDLEAGMMAIGNVQAHSDMDKLMEIVGKEIVMSQNKDVGKLLDELFAKFMLIKMLEEIAGDKDE